MIIYLITLQIKIIVVKKIITILIYQKLYKILKKEIIMDIKK